MRSHLSGDRLERQLLAGAHQILGEPQPGRSGRAGARRELLASGKSRHRPEKLLYGQLAVWVQVHNLAREVRSDGDCSSTSQNQLTVERQTPVELRSERVEVEEDGGAGQVGADKASHRTERVEHQGRGGHFPGPDILSLDDV